MFIMPIYTEAGEGREAAGTCTILRVEDGLFALTARNIVQNSAGGGLFIGKRSSAECLIPLENPVYHPDDCAEWSHNIAVYPLRISPRRMLYTYNIRPLVTSLFEYKFKLNVGKEIVRLYGYPAGLSRLHKRLVGPVRFRSKLICFRYDEGGFSLTNRQKEITMLSADKKYDLYKYGCEGFAACIRNFWGKPELFGIVLGYGVYDYLDNSPYSGPLLFMAPIDRIHETIFGATARSRQRPRANSKF